MSSQLLEFLRTYGMMEYTPNGRGLIHVDGDEAMAILSPKDEEPITVDIQTVNDWLRMQDEAGVTGTFMGTLAGMRVTPPYPCMFMEYQSRVLDSLYEVHKQSVGAMMTIGVVVNTIDAVASGLDMQHAPEGTRWVVRMGSVQSVPGKNPTFLPVAVGAFLSEDGVILGEPKMLDHTHGAPSAVQEVWRNNVVHGAFVALHACMFCHVRGAEIEEVEPTKHERKKAQRKGKPLHRHHKLRILPLEKHLRKMKSMGIHGSQGLRALHTVRGHFATYTADKPLFGHYVGTVWHPPHIRGDKAEGIVTKDYEVEPPNPAA